VNSKGKPIIEGRLPVKCDMADRLYEELKSKFDQTFLHGTSTTTADNLESEPFLPNKFKEVAELLERKTEFMPKQIVVVPHKMTGKKQEIYDEVFGKGSIVISEGEYARLEDECRKSAYAERFDRGTAIGITIGMSVIGLPVRFVGGPIETKKTKPPLDV